MQKFIIDKSAAIIIVVDQLALSDQRLISNLCKLNKSMQTQQHNLVLIVHNFSKINDQESLKKHQINLGIKILLNVHWHIVNPIRIKRIMLAMLIFRIKTSQTRSTTSQLKKSRSIKYLHKSQKISQVPKKSF